VASDAAALAISFTVTYPFGLIGLVLLVQLVPRWTRDPLHRGVETDDELDVRASGTAPLSLERSVELTRAYRVALDGVVDRSLADLDLIRRTGCVISRLHRDGSTSIPHAGTHLLLEDQLLVTGRLDELETFEGLIGPEVDATALLTGLPRARKVRVERREVVGKSLAELGLVRRHRCVITRIERQRILLEPMPGVRLEHGDVVDVTGERDQVRAAAAELGTFEPAADETNIALYAGGVGLGLLLGHLQLHLFSVTLTLGNAGGLILVGLAIGRFQRIGPFHARLPRAARQLVRDLGILLFVAETGVRAGNQIAGATIPHFWSMVLGGIPITLVPVLVSLVIARRVLDVRPVDAWGAICGGMTSSAALHAVRRAADSSEPAISYAAAYAVASVLVTIAGPLVVLLMS